MKHIRDKRVLITGAARGIGLEIARRFAAEGAHLLLTDLDPAALDQAASELAPARVSTFQSDVTDVAGIAELRKAVHAEGGPIDILVNNAGVVFGGSFLDVPVERHMTTYRVNTLGLVAMTHAFLPDLIERPEGHLVNIASASGFVGLPYGSTYASSKWSVIGFSESVRLELAQLGIKHVKLTIVCPSYVSTGLFEGVKPPLASTWLTPEWLAGAIVRAVRKERLWILAPWLVRITPFVRGILPGRLFDMVTWTLGVTSSMKHWKGYGATGERPGG